MQAFILIGLTAVLAGCFCIYMASPNQRWREAAWPRLPARVIGAALLAAGAWSFLQRMDTVAGLFAFATALMLFFWLVPYVGALVGIRRSR
ncbi:MULTISPECIES: hypothetical protein [unclassified Achromobacter]|uniref:hypothetical protein n=1 Tax=unclassified Achromobacter TaxID=2626865 RepID=UPI00069F5FD3|nr:MULTISPECIES: hypothetical protein [unclassified Achromobacter]KOF53439.1 hypothetical protein AD428_13585 [Achromobacter sp. DMS1]